VLKFIVEGQKSTCKERSHQFGILSKEKRKSKKMSQYQHQGPLPHYTEKNRKQRDRIYRVWLANPCLRQWSTRWSHLQKVGRYCSNVQGKHHNPRGAFGVPIVLQLSLHKLQKAPFPSSVKLLRACVHVRDVRKIAGRDDVVAGLQSIGEPSCQKLST
jgi:hypothetical protein